MHKQRSPKIPVIALLIIAVLGIGGCYAWQAQITDKPAPAKTTHRAADAYTGWSAYTDTGYSEASGITIKYPSDWRVKVGDSKAFAWQIIQNAGPNASIGVRVVYLASGTTPQQAWDDCPSADACGPTPDSLKLAGETTSVNGLDSYKAKMRDSSGTVYYSTVIKGDRQANGTVIFVEFTINDPDSATLATYNQIIRSAHF